MDSNRSKFYSSWYIFRIPKKRRYEVPGGSVRITKRHKLLTAGSERRKDKKTSCKPEVPPTYRITELAG